MFQNSKRRFSKVNWELSKKVTQESMKKRRNQKKKAKESRERAKVIVKQYRRVLIEETVAYFTKQLESEDITFPLYKVTDLKGEFFSSPLEQKALKKEIQIQLKKELPLFPFFVLQLAVSVTPFVEGVRIYICLRFSQ